MTRLQFRLISPFKLSDGPIYKLNVESILGVRILIDKMMYDYLGAVTNNSVIDRDPDYIKIADTFEEVLHLL